MNHDDHKPDLSTLIDPELEARIVAWVSGEASPFEAAELTRLTAEKPELAIFKRRIEAVRGLVAEAIRPDPESLRLAPDRRAKLLQALGATDNKTAPATSTSTVVLPMAATNKKQRKDRRWLFAIAASLTVGLFTVVSIPHFQKMRYEDAKRPIIFDRISEENAVRVEMPVAESHTEREQKNREEAYRYAISDAEKRKSEREVKEMYLNARAEANKQAALQAAEDSRLGAVSPELRYRQTATARTEVAAPAPALGGLGTSYQNIDVSGTLANNGERAELKDVTQDWVAFGKAAPAKPSENVPAQNNEIVRLEEYSMVGPKEGRAPAIALQKLSINPKLVVSADQFGDISESGPTPPSAPQAVRGLLENTTPGQYGADKKAKTDSLASSQEQILLSPFSVSASNDKGYAAKDSLGGARTSQAASEKDDDKPLVRANEKAQRAQQFATTFSEINASREPVSTFSLHVSDVSFHLTQAALAKGEEPDAESIRPEEFYNAFSYGDPTPALAEKVSCRIEQAAHPFAQQRNLVRIAVKVAASGRDAAQPLHLTVLLDTSGSMEREDRAATIQSAMKALTSLLGPNDRLTLIGFSRQPRLLAESLAGDQATQVLDLIKNTPSEGGTNLEEALKLGSELARRQFAASAQNRIVLLTDGAANLGNANPAQLAASIEALRQSGIAFDACGVGLEGLDDGMLENLTRKGDGRYYVLNSPEAADAGFAKQLAGAFRPAAENVKLQVRFNPARVGHYRLIGFEQHRLKEEDFLNDKVDAAELAAEEAAVAVYQVEALPQGEGELGEVYVRFRDTSSGNMVERSWTLNYDAQAPAFDRATPSIQLAGTAALLAEKLQGGEASNAINLGDLAPIVNKLRSHYANEPRVQELVTMFEQARKLAGE